MPATAYQAYSVCHMYKSPTSALQNVFILVVWANLGEFIIYQELLLRHTSL